MEEKRKARHEEKQRKAPRKRNPFVISLLVALCGAIWIAPSLVPSRGSVLNEETLEQGAKLTLYLASLRIRDYHKTHKTLPSSLSEAGVEALGILYTPGAGSVFELSTGVKGAQIVYRSTVPDSVFLGPNVRIRGIG